MMSTFVGTAEANAVTEPSRQRPATYADLEAVPPHLVAEIIDGELLTHPRPSPRHGATASALGAELGGSRSRRAEVGPAGGYSSIEPELHLGPHVVVPDIAGWRRSSV